MRAMTIGKKILVLLATALMLAVTFFMPNLVAMVQDDVSSNQVTSQEISPVAVLDTATDASLMEKLLFLQKNYYEVPVDLRDFTNNADEMREAVKDALRMFEENGVFISVEDYDAEVQTWPFLASSDEMQSVRVLWRCSVETEAGEFVAMIIDDETGKMLNFAMFDAKRYNLTTEVWGDILATYYGFYEVFTEQQTQEYAELTFVSEYGESVTLPFYSSHGQIYFNGGGGNVSVVVNDDGQISDGVMEMTRW